MIARKVIFFRKYRYFNSLSNATHPIQIHRVVLEKLQFGKKSEKNLTSNISEIYGSTRLKQSALRAHVDTNLSYQLY